MEPHFELTDLDFEKSFEDCSLNPELFTHEAHLRLAWIHIMKYGELSAIDNVCSQLLNYVEFLGVRQKYNHTLSVAAVKAVTHFTKRSDSETFQEFIAEFPRLKYNFRDLMKAHYKIDIFNADLTRNVYVEPDLLPFN
jgi:hypothetical protein